MAVVSDVDNIPILMVRSKWSDEKVSSLCGPDLPPIMPGFAQICRTKPIS